MEGSHVGCLAHLIVNIGEQVVRRKELQASCSFSGRTQKESLAYEDSSPLLQGGLEGVKAALIRPSPLKGPSPLGDQSAVSSPGKTTDPIVVVVRRNTQAAVEGFMVDIGESPSKKASKEVPSPTIPLDFVKIFIPVLVRPSLCMRHGPFLTLRLPDWFTHWFKFEDCSTK